LTSVHGINHSLISHHLTVAKSYLHPTYGNSENSSSARYLPRRIPWTTAVGRWSHVKSRLHIPRHDSSRWPHWENWTNWL